MGLSGPEGYDCTEVLKKTLLELAFVKEGLHAASDKVKKMREPEVADRIRRGMEFLTPRERALADYMLSNLEQVPMMTSAQIALESGVSVATVTRFAQNLGLSGFLELRDILRTELRAAYKPGSPVDSRGFLADFWRAEAENLQKASSIPEQEVQCIADVLAEARTVWVGGVQTMRPIAAALEYLLGLFRNDVRLLVEDVRTRPETLLDVMEDDVTVLFTVRRYARATTRVGEGVLARGARLILVTDDGAPPLARKAHQVLRVPTKGAAPLLSITAFLQICQVVALLVGAKCGNERNDAAEDLFRRYETFEL